MSLTNPNKLINVQELDYFKQRCDLLYGGAQYQGTCSDAGGTAAKTVTVDSSFSLISGARVLVKFNNGISVANATLSVNSGTAKSIYYHGAALAANLVKAGAYIELEYDGTNWEIIGDLDTDTTYQAGTAQMLTAGTDTNQSTWTPKILKDWFADNYLIPVNMDALSPNSTFIKGNVVAINGIFYRATTNTSNFPITLITQGNNFLYNEVNGHRAYIVASYTLNSGWEVWTDAGIDYHIERAERLYPLSGVGAPTIAPSYIGQLYVDTSTPKLYCAKRVTGSTSDWFAV